MHIRADFAQRALVDGSALTWVPSPMPGVTRCMLDRVGEEVARATSLVRYAPGSAFSPHVHAMGEEFLVLEGVFSDEHGDHGPGCYVRNPPGSRHQPASAPGCVIFVKLRQMQPHQSQRVTVRSDRQPLHPLGGGRQGLDLYRDDHEHVLIEQWARGTRVPLPCPGGAELLVLAGSLVVDGQALPPWSWLRAPAGDTLALAAGPAGVRLWQKRGHLGPPRG